MQPEPIPRGFENRVGIADRRYRLACLASHPIQYQAPLFRALARHPEIDLHVFFCSRWGVESYLDPGFHVRFCWDVPLLEGYRSTFLRNFGSASGPGGFSGLVNPGILAPILRNHFDALLINGWACASNWLSFAAAFTGRVPVLLRGESDGLSRPTGVKAFFRRGLLGALFERVAAFLAIGTRNREFYRSYGVPAGKIFWTPYAVDNRFFQRRADALRNEKDSLRRRENIRADRPLILFAGKFIEKKRPADIIKAVALMPPAVRPSVAFVGDGPMRAELQRLVADLRLNGIHFLGFRNQTQMAPCYAMADAFVLPSSIEPWGLVVNEAMCFGLPIVVSNKVGAAADLVHEDRNGFVFPFADVPALVKCLEKVTRSEVARAEMGRRSLQIINQWGIPQDIEGILCALHHVAVANRATVSA